MLVHFSRRDTCVSQDFTGLAAAVQLRLRVAFGLQALQRCSGLLNRRARGSTVATHHPSLGIRATRGFKRRRTFHRRSSKLWIAGHYMFYTYVIQSLSRPASVTLVIPQTSVSGSWTITPGSAPTLRSSYLGRSRPTWLSSRLNRLNTSKNT